MLNGFSSKRNFLFNLHGEKDITLGVELLLIVSESPMEIENKTPVHTDFTT
jgi:hypothetical protein